MAPNPLNVFAGRDSLRQYYDPECNPPLPLVELPDSLNPYRDDGVRIYAKMMTMLPANNVKALPALNLLDKTVQPGKTDTVVEYSSGSTVISMSLISRAVHGINDVRAYLSNKTSEPKLKLLQFFGLDITLFGGPSQPEPLDERGGIQAARRDAIQSESIVNPNQYENDANWRSHYRWTGPQILKQLPHINVICAGMGTAGTMTGIGMFFKDAKPSVARIGVCTAAGDRVPGPRSYALMAPVEFPWREAVDHLEEVGSEASYRLSLALSREGLICGPSSGFSLQGLLNFIEKKKTNGNLDTLRNEDGEIHCAFLCCDLPYQYIPDYFSRLDDSSFHPIKNHSLVDVDLYRYDEAWELSVEESVARYCLSLGDGTQDSIILDLRESNDFASWHVSGAINVPMASLRKGMSSPFFNSLAMEDQWQELERMFQSQVDHGSLSLKGKRVLILCYDGDTSRVATSVARAKG